MNNINQNILNKKENINKIYFQNYFHNIIINPSNYNYFYYKLFDIKGNELSLIKYKDSSKIVLFYSENNSNKNDLNNNENNIINNVII